MAVAADDRSRSRPVPARRVPVVRSRAQVVLVALGCVVCCLLVAAVVLHRLLESEPLGCGVHESRGSIVVVDCAPPLDPAAPPAR